MSQTAISTSSTTGNASKVDQEDPQGLISEKTFEDLLHVNVVACVIASVGFVGNCVNIVVFAKQGFEDTINITLFSLSVCDLATVISLFWTAVFMLPWYRQMALPLRPLDGWNRGGWQAGTLAYTTCWLAVFISVERCLCIVKPLQVKNIITRKVTIITVVIIFTVCLWYLVTIQFIITQEMIHDSSIINSTTTATTTTSTDAMAMSTLVILKRVAYGVHICMQLGSFFILPLATVTLIVSLQRKTQWRSKAKVSSSSVSQGAGEGAGAVSEKSGGMDARDRRVVKMVILVSMIIIGCVSPGLLLNIASMIEPDFEIGFRYERLNIACWSCAFCTYCINSTVNVFVYYNMSSRFRATLQTMFCLEHAKVDSQK